MASASKEEQYATDCDESPTRRDGQASHHDVYGIAANSATHGLSASAARLASAELFFIFSDAYSTSAYVGTISTASPEFEDRPV